ncbi:hypothetical protein KOY48_05520 [Candidatus Minimicrobia naudis]|uniref:Uncharacterized protein n=1 Tax=Candidatus Minimicrobia naudis TaxID=2841263 RepID=A0A8F1MCH4_9BACT|nr:hypothetical protein KOY48_05520 [Candidatus Minimicrobia naudis]
MYLKKYLVARAISDAKVQPAKLIIDDFWIDARIYAKSFHSFWHIVTIANDLKIPA